MKARFTDDIDALPRAAAGAISRPQVLTTAACTVTAILLATAARAAEDTQNASLSEVVVTSSRIVRDGYQAPTPTMVLGAEEIERAAPVNIADQVNQMPSLAGSTRMNASTISSGLAGLNVLNLRNLGTGRTLVLLDGQRIPAATMSGVVDVNTIPNSLISRVDVVTGGASAAWGSAAVAGVINFVLDKKFIGFKSEVSGGLTTYGDDPNATVSAAFGTGFANNRGHLLLSAEEYYSGGINKLSRPWYVAARQLNNPAYTATNGQPRLLARTNVGYTTVAPGAIVTAGPLRGLYFGPNGAPLQLNYGTTVSDPFMVGGDWKVTDFGAGVQSFDPPTRRRGIFERASYDITDNFQIFQQFSFNRSYVSLYSTPQYNFGGLTINNDNPFLPPSVVAAMQAANVTTLTVGSWNQAIGGLPYKSNHDMFRYTLGANGKFNAMGKEWSWEVSLNRNSTDIYQDLYLPINANYRNALDAVLGPNGQITCRSTLTDPANGCQPLNLLGTGVASQAALAYVNGHGWLKANITQDIVQSTLRSEPFSTWAGPVSAALGIEHRRESVSGSSDPISQSNGFWAGNYKAVTGSFDVTEGFFEIVAPLANDATFARSLDFNAAVRLTDYSTSGEVNTWKVGGTWAPIEDLKLRVTKSRDIRAGGLSELFGPGTVGPALLTDPFLNNQSYTHTHITVGNPDVMPEKADTIGIGAVVQPRFLPGLSFAVDYWDIEVKDAITTLTSAETLQHCYRGNQRVCQNIIRDPSTGLITTIIRQPLNLTQLDARGIDIEASYRFPAGGGQVSLRALATRYLQSETFNGVAGSASISTLGSATGVPDWRYLMQGTYAKGPLAASLTARGISNGVLSAQYIECSSNCPVSTTDNPTIDNNHVAGALYFDLSVSYKIQPGIETFLVVNNLLNRDPARVADAPSIGGAQLGVSPLYYDVLGRTFRGGVRFKF
ncbi:MAG: TonB-dependent receptor [Steroidobacteraceae bacterium]